MNLNELYDQWENVFHCVKIDVFVGIELKKEKKKLISIHFLLNVKINNYIISNLIDLWESMRIMYAKNKNQLNQSLVTKIQSKLTRKKEKKYFNISIMLKFIPQDCKLKFSTWRSNCSSVFPRIKKSGGISNTLGGTFFREMSSFIRLSTRREGMEWN